jgi:hypothetical protein
MGTQRVTQRQDRLAADHSQLGKGQHKTNRAYEALRAQASGCTGMLKSRGSVGGYFIHKFQEEEERLEASGMKQSKPPIILLYAYIHAA